MTICKQCEHSVIQPSPSSATEVLVFCNAALKQPYVRMDWVLGVTRWTFDGKTFEQGDTSYPPPAAKRTIDPYKQNNGNCALYVMDPNKIPETIFGV